MPDAALAGSEPYTPDNLLDRISQPETLEANYRYLTAREQAILARRLRLAGSNRNSGTALQPGGLGHRALGLVGEQHHGVAEAGGPRSRTDCVASLERLLQSLR